MSIKLLKKYKEKFNINKITLIDNAQIYCNKGGKFNLSQYLLFTNGNTWYEKFGFILKEKNKREILDKSKKVLKDLKIKDINFKAIFDDIEKNEKSKILNKNLIIQDKDVINKYKDVINKYKDENFMKIFNYIFYANRSDETCLLYSLIAPSLIRQIEKNFSDFTRLEQLEYYLIL
jgi:phosphoenolpyruvate synthase/pyruvate phosphate dikinase